MALELVATCALGLEALTAEELTELGVWDVVPGRGAVSFRGRWRDVWRANLLLRTANRVLVRLASWPAADGDALAAGAAGLVSDSGRDWDGVSALDLFAPERSLAVRASSNRSRITDVRWIGLRTKDGIVDAQRRRFGRRASVDRKAPDLALRLFLERDRATLLIDTSGQPLDRRGYRQAQGPAPVREQLAAACVLAAGWDGTKTVLDPMCGSGTLLVEAGWFALGRAPGCLRQRWAFERLPGFDADAFSAIRETTLPVRDPDIALIGWDRDPKSVESARRNLSCAGLEDHSRVRRQDAFEAAPPAGPGLLITNPAYGKRLETSREQMRRLGDLLKQRYPGWRAVILAGDPDKGKHIGLRAARKIPVKNGPIDARILVFDIR